MARTQGGPGRGPGHGRGPGGGPPRGPGGQRGEGGGDRRRRGDGDRQPRERSEESEFAEKLVSINRVAKVVKGGRRFGFAALVVVGDRKGRVGYGSGKAREVPEAIRKATEQARRGLVRVPLREGRTFHHDMVDSYGAGKVVIRSAKAGTGIIAGGPMRAIFEALGVQDVVAKSVGSSNPHNMIKATFAALTHATSPRAVAARRGKKVSEVLGRRETEATETA
jgi:small subunit ribosomal protein S5